MVELGRNTMCPCGSGKKYKYCCMEKKTANSIKTLKFNEYTVIIKRKGVCYKIFQIMFGKDESLYVNFPYYKHKEGILSHATLKAGSDKLNLEEGGKVTSHLVKFSYHPDGRVHFSQTGRIKTLIKKQSVPFASQDGHIFTLQLKCFSDFQKFETKKPTHKRHSLLFNLEGTDFDAVKFVGWFYSKKNIKAIIPKNSKVKSEKDQAGPVFNFLTPKGERRIAVLLSFPNLCSPEEYILFLTCQKNEASLKSDVKSHLTFLGGFDSKEITHNHLQDTSCLALTYPIEYYEKLIHKIGSVDL